MLAEDFSAWLSAIAGMSAEQLLEAAQALAEGGHEVWSFGRRSFIRRAKAASAAYGWTRLEPRALSGWKARAARIAPVARWSVGAARMGC